MVTSKDYSLILECYHPSTKSIEPSLSCHYITTPGLSSNPRTISDTKGENSVTELRNLYSHFRPMRQNSSGRTFRPHPAGEVPSSRTHQAAAVYTYSRDVQDALVSHNVNLEPHELFSQLCVATHRVQLGHRGRIYSIANVTEGVVRIWRQWLAQRAKSNDEKSIAGSPRILEDDQGEYDENEDKDDGANMLWVDDRKDVGIRVRVKENSWKRNGPILLLKDEDPAVSYTIEYEGA